MVADLQIGPLGSLFSFLCRGGFRPASWVLPSSRVPSSSRASLSCVPAASACPGLAGEAGASPNSVIPTGEPTSFVGLERRDPSQSHALASAIGRPLQLRNLQLKTINQ